MEIRINKEIREYTESIFFGLSLRQLLFAFLAVGAAIGLFFGLRNHLHIETLGWVCIVGAFPFAAMGFIRYNGMTFERLIAVFIKSQILMPAYLLFKSTNLLREMLSEWTDEMKKEMKKSNG